VGRMKGNKSDIINYMSGDDTVSAYLAVPEEKGPHPSLILIHEWWGLNDWVENKADEFAGKGYISLAIDLYRGKSTSSPEEARMLSGSVPQERAVRDLISAFDYLRNMKEVSKNYIGSIGWCMGGGYSLKAAINIPDLAACVINYGRLVNDTEILRKINCPVLGIFGERDQNIIPADVRVFEEALNGAGIKNKIIFYPDVGHAFMNPANKNLYNKSMADKAWVETYSFLNDNLMQKSI
jgi:carboxymethylenebutenolidase